NASADRPVPVGLALADHLLSCHIAQGVVALLVRRARTGRGGLVETSLLEGMLDLQLERLTARLSEASTPAVPGAGPTVAAASPVSGVFPTRDGWLALTAAPDRLARLLGTSASAPAELSGLLRSQTTAEWLGLLDADGVWCSPVLSLEELLVHDAFRAAEMTQTVERPPREPGGTPVHVTTTRSPIRIDGETLVSGRGAPRLGAQGRVGTSTVLTDAEEAGHER
ncbi:MAG: CoA transferase, partial [Janthinobacterium lividum]